MIHCVVLSQHVVFDVQDCGGLSTMAQDYCLCGHFGSYTYTGICEDCEEEGQ